MMNSQSARVISRLGPLLALTWTHSAAVSRIGCRYLRVPRFVGGSKPRNVPIRNLQFEDSELSQAPGNLIRGSDWQVLEGKPLQLELQSRATDIELDSEETSDNEAPAGPKNGSSEPTDLLMEKIRRSGGVEMILDLVERHDRIMNHHHLAQAVGQLFDQIMKRDRLTESARHELLQDPRFTILCTRLIRSHRYMSPYAVIEVLKLLSAVRTPVNSRITQTYIHMLKESLNDLSLNGLMYAATLLPSFSENRVAEALLIAVPLAFEMRMDKEMDPRNLDQLLAMLKFCVTFHVRRKCISTIVPCLKACLKHDKTKGTMSISDAAQLFVRLERGNVREEFLFNHIFDVIDRKQVQDLRRGLAKKLLGSIRYLRAKHPADYPPNHRIFEIERRVSGFFPQPADSDSNQEFLSDSRSPSKDNFYFSRDDKQPK